MAASDSASSLSANARVLVIHVARIGDTLLATPALRTIKFAAPAGKLGVLAHPSRRELLQGLPFIDELGTVTPNTAWWRARVGARRWDVALVYGHDAPLIRYAARAAERVVAFDQKDPTLNTLLWKTVAVPNGMHAVHERLLLATALGIVTQDFRLSYALTAQEQTAAKGWIAEHILGGPLIGFQIASFATKPYRDWPLDHFVELARRILARWPRARILVFGDKQSRAGAQHLIQTLGARVISLAGRFRLRETAALMSQLQLYVGVDTGPTHLAGALRVPMVALYHCRHRGRLLAPLQHEHLRVVEHPATDADCAATTSMSAIDVDSVWTAVQSLSIK